PQSVNPQEPFMTRVSKWPVEIRDYYDDLKKEMRLVSWPTWKQVRATTTVVIIAVFLFAFYFWAVDLIVSFLMNKLFAYIGKS
ncbi:MAG TPA: preprotein translocase subunit SecE, partial [Bryobacteraceae bacterium]